MWTTEPEADMPGRTVRRAWFVGMAIVACSAFLLLCYARSNFVDPEDGIPYGASLTSPRFFAALLIPAAIIWLATPGNHGRAAVPACLAFPIATVLVTLYSGSLFHGDLDDSPGMHPVAFAAFAAIMYCAAHGIAASSVFGSAMRTKVRASLVVQYPQTSQLPGENDQS